MWKSNRGKWPVKDQAIFLKRLSYLLQKGYTLSTAIEFLKLYQSRNRKDDLELIVLNLKQGTPFFDVLSFLGFSSDALSYIFFAVKHGDLETGLLQAGEFLDKKIAYKNKLVAVMRYPLFLLVFVGILLAIMQDILLQQFISLQESIDDLPQSRIINTAMLLQLDFAQISLAILIFSLFLFTFYWFYFRRKQPIEKQLFLCKLPVLRKITSKYNTYFFSFHLGTLLGSGLSINDALSVFEEQDHLLFFNAESKRIRKFLLEGEQLEKILKVTPYYEDELSTIIIHGQANGLLVNELLDYSQIVIDRLEGSFKLWLRLLQPMVIIFVGLLVILMYLAIMLPLYGMMQTL
ncbi:competence type IV pilus assembly protein ComGB [Bacillus sp. Marseille-P3661]|uniref:competence type IV pilus assembly protein ComGB n=1 Tax=Bacillus sp. Marseille-P3661 TaxID=1936234 RepID=UPI000C818604|nr:competence type IV pilus assembly protein ComGB [Bacillus sp. Marseille-P3661]